MKKGSSKDFSLSKRKKTKSQVKQASLQIKQKINKRKIGRDAIRSDEDLSLQKQMEVVEESKFTTVAEISPQGARYELPVRYGDNRIMLLPRDPWWLHTYWDISETKKNEVIDAIPAHERDNLRWILRVHDVTGVGEFQGGNSNSSFDLGINFDANNWYINVNQPERDWCVEIGLINSAGKFFLVARSNIIKTPYFGVSSVIDEEWALPDEEYYKVLGFYDLGKSSLERRKKLEEYIKQQISSPTSSWGGSPSKHQEEKDKFFLEVWTELILYGRTEADADVMVAGKKIKLRNDGTFSMRYALPVGDFDFEVVATSKNKKFTEKRVPAVKRYDK